LSPASALQSITQPLPPTRTSHPQVDLYLFGRAPAQAALAAEPHTASGDAAMLGALYGLRVRAAGRGRAAWALPNGAGCVNAVHGRGRRAVPHFAARAQTAAYQQI
jgi:hypothetical protein